MRIAIANFGAPFPGDRGFAALWEDRPPVPAPPPRPLFDQAVDWGFHVYALGVHLREKGLAREVEYWDYAAKPSAGYHPNGVLRVLFANLDDVRWYLERRGAPDLFLNYGRGGLAVLDLLEGRSFRVHVPALRTGAPRGAADCFLVDSEDDLDDRSMLYVPVVNTQRIFPAARAKERDFLYLAADYPGKRHDLLLEAVRGTDTTGHLHPVDGAALDLAGTRVTTSAWNERDVVELMRTSRIAVYAGDRTSNPAAMWECVAAGLPIVVNAAIHGGKHVVVPGVTGELSPPDRLHETMRAVLESIDRYRPHEHFARHWGTIATIERYLDFFVAMGWRGPCS